MSDRKHYILKDEEFPINYGYIFRSGMDIE